MKRIAAGMANGILIATLNGCEMMKASAESQSARERAGNIIMENLSPEEQKKMERLILEGIRRFTPEQTKKFGKAIIDHLENLSPEKMKELDESLRKQIAQVSPECAKLDAEEAQLIKKTREYLTSETKGREENIYIAMDRTIKAMTIRHRQEKHDLRRELCREKHYKKLISNALEKVGKRLEELGAEPHGDNND